MRIAQRKAQTSRERVEQTYATSSQWFSSMALPLSRGKNHGHGSVWKAVDHVAEGAGKWITVRGVRLCLCRLRVHKKGLAEGGRQACGVHGLRVSSKWAHIGAGKKKKSCGSLDLHAYPATSGPTEAFLLDLEGREASVRSATQQALNTCLLDRWVDGWMHGWLSGRDPVIVQAAGDN